MLNLLEGGHYVYRGHRRIILKWILVKLVLEVANHNNKLPQDQINDCDIRYSVSISACTSHKRFKT